jgi:hypothetical protein
MRWGWLLLTIPGIAFPDEISRALIERDQRTAEFAAGANRAALEGFHYRQMQLRPVDRERVAREREAFVLQLPPPKPNPVSVSKPLPLPGGPKHLVQPIPSQGVGG